MKKFAIIFLFIISASTILAQDMHFSQYYAAPLSLNPAQTGLIKGRLRIGINSKNQWSSVSKPYQTISAYFDMQAMRRKYRKDAVGVGILFDADIAGDSRFSTILAGFSLSYIKSLTSRNNNFISVGIMPALVQKSIDYSKLYYDSQYNGNSYDPSIDPCEQYRINNFAYFDLSAGIHWFYQQRENISYNAGFAISHFTRPRQGFMNDRHIQLDMKYVLYGGSQVKIGYKLDLAPSMMLAFQGPYTEAVLGAMLKYNRSKSYIDYTSVNLGLYMRYADALIVLAGFEFKNINFGVSYDVNLSKLRRASIARGGLEFSVSYIYDKNKYKRNRQIPCPIF